MKAVHHGLSAPPMEQKSIRVDGSTIDVEAQSEPILFDKRPAALSILRAHLPDQGLGGQRAGTNL